mmetsp:Transcript_23343/g.44281  ORF Transcript_23343/g.44281 Transcript_23343/m.44281 type:complete len:264 (+) Transcript_23343:159-950(+)
MRGWSIVASLVFLIGSSTLLFANAFLIPHTPSKRTHQAARNDSRKVSSPTITMPCNSHTCMRYPTALGTSSSDINDNHEENDKNPHNNNDDDESNSDSSSSPSGPITSEFQSIKNDRYGADIPTALPQPDRDDLQAAASNAENSFLAAMIDQRSQFQQIKSQEGSDQAVEVFKERIQRSDEEGRRELASELEQELREEQSLSLGEEEGDGSGGGDDVVEEEFVVRERMEKRWFVQEVRDENNDEYTKDDDSKEGGGDGDREWQ